MSVPEYPYIRAWGSMMGSDQYYIDIQIDKAREDKAPQDSIYEVSMPGTRRSHQWRTFRDITNEATKEIIGTIVFKRYGIEPDKSGSQ